MEVLIRKCILSYDATCYVSLLMMNVSKLMIILKRYKMYYIVLYFKKIMYYIGTIFLEN